MRTMPCGTCLIQATAIGSVKSSIGLTMVSVSGKTARTCYDKLDHIDTTLVANARGSFSEPKADDVPDFQSKMAKAIKKLIVLDGGAPEKDLF